MSNNFKVSNNLQGQFISVIPDEQITENSFDETVQLLIDHVLDLSSFETDYNNEKGGASAYPPTVLLKIILAAYSRGITSSCKIENLCRYNTVFMCLSGFLTPDHSTIAAFASKQSSQLADLFVQLAEAGFNTLKNVSHCFNNCIDAYLADGGMRTKNPLYKDRDRKKPSVHAYDAGASALCTAVHNGLVRYISE